MFESHYAMMGRSTDVLFIFIDWFINPFQGTNGFLTDGNDFVVAKISACYSCEKYQLFIYCATLGILSLTDVHRIPVL